MPLVVLQGFLKALQWQMYILLVIMVQQFPANTQFRSSTTSRFFDLRDDVVLSPDNCHGVGITITTISPNTEYILYYRSVE